MEKLEIKDLLSFKGEIEREKYFVWGLLLFGIKYLLDRAISGFVFQKYWFITNYFIRQWDLNPLNFSKADQTYYLTMILLSIPFVYAGTVLCIKRLRNIGLHPLLVIFFFVLGLNFILFLILCLLPAKAETSKKTNAKNSYLSKLIPVNGTGNIALSVGLVVFIGLLLILFSVNVLGQYGWGLFIGTPFFLGFTSVLFYNYHSQKTFSQSLGIALSSLAVLGAVILFLAMEGLICILMAFPIAAILAIIGATLAYSIDSGGKQISGGLMLSVALFIPFSSFIENAEHVQPQVREVKTSILIKAKPEKVWKEVIYFKPIAAPKEWLFRAGISYPVKARIEGEGKGAVRYCIFNNGCFVEPIETWEAPRLLQFAVTSQPEPLTELSPYRHLDVPHLHGYFQSVKGQFLLKETKDGYTLLEGTTWYYQKFTPQFYWGSWAEYILHQIHLRVLNNIKKECEI